LKVKLIGIKTNEDKKAAAIKFLQTKLRNQRVFIKFDALKHDEKQNVLCYLYLKNKTFINAHLIKNNLVDVDSSFDYRHKSRFLSFNQ